MILSEEHRSDLVVWQVVLFAVLLLLFRMAGIYYLYFFEEDESFIAAGVAAMVRDNVGDLYRYTPQLGYYRLIELFTLVFGADVARIPAIMKVFSAVMGTVIPVAALFAFREALGVRQRWLAALVLVANPIIWKSSQYGNSAMAATGLACVALVLLSNRPRRIPELLALILFAVAVLVRADTVLLVPVLGLLLYYNHQTLRDAGVRLLLLGLGLFTVYGLLFLFDPCMDNAASAISTHFTLDRKTMFWEYLLWAVSPLPLAFAVLGLSRLLDIKPGLLLLLLIWVAAPLAFYFTSTTTPRYMLLAVMPLALAGAVGMIDLASRLQTRIGRRLAWSAVLVAGFIHLLVGLGHFPSAWRASPLYGPTFTTDDGEMPTGALVYDAYLRHGFLRQSFLNRGFGREETPKWEGMAFARAFESLEKGEGAGKTTVFLISGGFGLAFHYHAQVEGARYLSRAPADVSLPFTSETWLELHGSRVMTISVNTDYYRQLEQFRVSEGDRFWVSVVWPFPNQAALNKLPPGLELVEVDSFYKKIRVFEVRRGAG